MPGDAGRRRRDPEGRSGPAAGRYRLRPADAGDAAVAGPDVQGHRATRV